ncbi:Uma2 family endonuclease [Nocardiopsis sp. HUAS JQ3]|uniref:Uma2 family endonuclease n=1 Tax=Nocardiopsis sp. HUAS JQ3 TaxID=3061629 RepID=UPI0023A91BF4|nr:Uma2 family endonuclease [Nocardiopsis sp. HUAS JQ3]WDZ93755.1 Uma2 family endonuclease [Nocardiopsis sp. HUAS JQ3]
MTSAPVPDWLIPPVEGFRSEDLDRLTGLPPHSELIDGSIVLPAPREGYHSVVLDLLTIGLRHTIPAHYRVRRGMTVTLGPRQRPEPDIMVVDAGAVDDRQSTFPADAVALVVEVVSQASAERDRKRKPFLYAEAVIPHFWRIEEDGSGPVVYVYELDPAGPCYVSTGIHHDRLKVEFPYPVDIDLTEVHRL